MSPMNRQLLRGIPRWLAASASIACLVVSGAGRLAAASPPELEPAVEIEEDVYRYEPADNGAGPMWCHGSTCLGRIGDEVFATGLETLKEAKPLNNCRWMLFRRGPAGWEKVWTDLAGRTREPAPLAVFPDGRLHVSGNPTLMTNPAAYGGPARPEIVPFAARNPRQPEKALLPKWSGSPEFSEHSYRSFAADGPARELILFQNIGYTHAEWAFLDRKGEWSAQGRLAWPWGAEYAKPQPIRVCYPNVALKGRAVHFCGVSDIVEPNPAWRAYKKQLTGREWDYDFRRLFYTWSPDIASGRFEPWVEIASREATCGWILPGDLWIGPDDRVRVLWTERALDERLRDKFYPGEVQRHSLKLAVLRRGQVLQRQTVAEAEEGKSHEQPGRGRFHATPDGRLFVIYHVSGADSAKRPLSENRLAEVRADGSIGPARRIPFRKPFTEFFTATPRAGSPPSDRIDLLGIQQGAGAAIGYARVRLGKP